MYVEYTYMPLQIEQCVRAVVQTLRSKLDGRDGQRCAWQTAAPSCRTFYMRNLLGWLETRLAQVTLHFLNVH